MKIYEVNSHLKLTLKHTGFLSEKRTVQRKITRHYPKKNIDGKILLKLTNKELKTHKRLAFFQEELVHLFTLENEI